MELADLTRGMRKKKIEPEKMFFFGKPGLSEFHESSAEKSNFLEPDKLCACKARLLTEFHTVSAQKK